MDPFSPGSDPAAVKAALREDRKAWRERLSQSERDRMSRMICRRAAGLLAPCRTVCLYMSKPPEVDTRPLAGHLLREGVCLVVPVIEKDTRTLRLSAVTDLSTLVQSTFNVPEPIGSEIPVDPASVDAAVVPMIAFDRGGSRLGYGAGYYDRFLSLHTHIRTIGLAFSGQEVAGIPADPLDIPMDAIVTEREIIIP